MHNTNSIFWIASCEHDYNDDDDNDDDDDATFIYPKKQP